jgi:hydroxymethylbilane synthase
MMSREILRVATRQSALAMWQTEHIRDLVQLRHPDVEVVIVGMTTRGDRIQDVPLQQVGGKGLFVKELETALIRGDADIAVHSMKDVPMELVDALEIGVICEREDPRDAFVSNRFDSLAELPSGAKVGTSSARRKSQLMARRPDLNFVDLRGNVDTRLRKLDSGDYDAIILAAAGLIRLGWEGRIRDKIAPEECIPSAGQGAIGIESRVGDQRVRGLVATLDHAGTHTCVRCERAVSRRLQASCDIPVGAYARLTGSQLLLTGMVASHDGAQVIRAQRAGDAADPDTLGEALAEELLERGAAKLLPA